MKEIGQRQGCSQREEAFHALSILSVALLLHQLLAAACLPAVDFLGAGCYRGVMENNERNEASRQIPDAAAGALLTSLSHDTRSRAASSVAACEDDAGGLGSSCGSRRSICRLSRHAE